MTELVVERLKGHIPQRLREEALCAPGIKARAC
jgi:hypothetical protein